MSPEVKERWIAALRSGEYEQHRGAMNNGKHGDYSKATAFCCLGVACHISNPDKSLINDAVALNGGAQNYLDIPFDEMNHLIHMNDQFGHSFIEIADWIEVNL